MAQEMGERFARAIASKSETQLLYLLDSDVDFRAMTPTRFWEATRAEEVVKDVIFGRWFAPTDEIEAVEHVECEAFADRFRVGYRFRVRNADGSFAVEQQAYYGVDGERITWLRIMCAGYRPLT
ncbi:MAG TPA: hypothetical protein VL119_10695 [Acidimicrobiia bacterium]|nr:hypothetical protein [Acidimicrobiia bacterium]